jgi:hypothetical protein
VTVAPRLRGDVAITIDAEGMPAADLRAILRDAMGCDWRVDDFERSPASWCSGPRFCMR